MFDVHKFQFSTFVAFVHFAVTSVFLEIGGRLKMFERKRIDLPDLFGLVGTFISFVVLTNLSLRFNSVGLYQVRNSSLSNFSLFGNSLILRTLAETVRQNPINTVYRHYTNLVVQAAGQ